MQEVSLELAVEFWLSRRWADDQINPHLLWQSLGGLWVPW